jgi:transcriptional regulator with XRE-family HTH domain
MLAKTQQELADTVGIRFQQIQKYETGANRVSASRLYDIASALDSSVADDETAKPEGTSGPAIPDFMSDKEALDFLRHYYRLDEEPRRRLLELTRSLSAAA